jgi:hypothetical protein
MARSRSTQKETPQTDIAQRGRSVSVPSVSESTGRGRSTILAENQPSFIGRIRRSRRIVDVATKTQKADDIRAEDIFSVGTQQLIDASITTAKLAPEAVTTAKINDLAVTTAKINDLAVTTAKLAADAVTSAKIGDDQIDSEHYAAGSIDLEHMSANSIDSDQYVDGSIDQAHMSANSIDSDQYVDGSIDSAHIGNDQIDSQHYAADSIDAEHLAHDLALPGEITKPNQPSFLAYNSSSDSGATGDNTVATVEFDTEVIDRGSDFNNSTDTFTAPISGDYLFLIKVETNHSLAGAVTSHRLRLVTSNRNYDFFGEIGTTTSVIEGIIAVVADMDASDTASVTVVMAGGSKNVSIAGSSSLVTYFSGTLLN